jgi:hypothetical protein
MPVRIILQANAILEFDPIFQATAYIGVLQASAALKFKPGSTRSFP